jgi:hypothetical protein
MPCLRENFKELRMKPASLTLITRDNKKYTVAWGTKKIPGLVTFSFSWKKEKKQSRISINCATDHPL